jgi:signal transduction histidine kinase
VTDGHGIILEANHAAAALLRCRKEFLIDKPLGLFVVAGFRSRFYESLTRVMRLVGADEFESLVGRGGETRDVLIRVAIVDQGASAPPVLRWLIRDDTEQRRTETARGVLLQRLVTAQEEERRRIARELHDEMGQRLTALILDLKLVGDTFPDGSTAREQLDRIRRSAGQIGQAIHHLALELRPTALDDVGLEATIRTHMAEWSNRTSLRAEYWGLGPTGEKFPPDIETTVYRITQEALTNVSKHAKATQVSVILERRDHSLRLIIEDDGRGFDADSLIGSPAGPNRLGLLGMRERVSMVGGSFFVESSPGGPTSIFVELPIRPPPNRRTANE